MIKNALLCFILVSLFIIVGCKSYQEGPAPSMKVTDARYPDATLRYDEIVILDKSLQSVEMKNNKKRAIGKIAIESKGKHRTATGMLNAVAVIRNRTDYSQQLECRVQFFDVNSIPVEGPTAWKRVFLPPNGIGSYKRNSTIPQAEYYYIEIREAR